MFKHTRDRHKYAEVPDNFITCVTNHVCRSAPYHPIVKRHEPCNRGSTATPVLMLPFSTPQQYLFHDISTIGWTSRIPGGLAYPLYMLVVVSDIQYGDEAEKCYLHSDEQYLAKESAVLFEVRSSCYMFSLFRWYVQGNWKIGLVLEFVKITSRSFQARWVW